MVFQNHSVTGDYLALTSAFSSVQVYPILSSEDVLENTPNFVYGSMADGAGLLANDDGTFTLINNIEADYSIARITLDETFRPVAGEYILNATATAATAQCSGSLITPEEHGFGPWYLSGGEWGGDAKGVYRTDVTKDAADASTPDLLTNLGEWSTENAVVIGKRAYRNQTVLFIGDDQSANDIPRGQLAMYVGDRGDLTGGNLYSFRVTTPGVEFEMDMVEGQEYDLEVVELNQTGLDALEEEAQEKGVISFSRVEDIDWRRGNGAAQREIYFVATGRKRDDLIGRGTVYGRIYKLTLNDDDPTGAAKLEVVLDGDNLTGKAAAFHSPDNILVTENYAYIQEDPNGYPDTPEKDHFARLYQYDLNTGELAVVLECDQELAANDGVGTADRNWEITGMIDISDIINQEETFILITQNHGWEPEEGVFTDPLANPDLENSRAEGSQLYVIRGLAR
ncbi:MAG TPA: phosphatase [Cytophagales bacterium]|nr:phosphatase [Cytophagales bacterium]HAA19484.1 phosphatase [Cytophagales bacterium]HAP59642.1 phosphatase [Cytophagales bacterium]